MKKIDLRWNEYHANPNPGVYKGYSLFEIQKAIDRNGSVQITFKNGIKKISVIGDSEEKVLQMIFDVIDQRKG